MIVNRFRTAAVLIGYPDRKRGESVLPANLTAAGISDASGGQGCSKQKCGFAIATWHGIKYSPKFIAEGLDN